jgi:hypothetical protein
MCKLLQVTQYALKNGDLTEDRDALSCMGALNEKKASGTITTAAAIYFLARHATAPVSGILRAAFALGSNTDTIAAMTGGLLGALNGSDWLPPEWNTVQDFQYLRQMANEIATQAAFEETSLKYEPVTTKTLASIIDSLENHQGNIDFGGAGQVHIVGSYCPTSLRESLNVVGWQLMASDGQTLYITKVSKKSSDEMSVTATQDIPKCDLNTSDSSISCPDVLLNSRI